MEGARWARKELLSSRAGADFRVYAVWFANYGDDHRSRWPADLLADPRVLHFWDEEKLLGRFYQSQLKSQQIAWDMFIAYAPEARWSDRRPYRHGRTIIGRHEDLAAALDELLQRPHITPPARRLMPYSR
ncbi:MAG TPA: hypothetical protein VFM29_05465 [Vicinamibacteria bacterium]|nr:hypothetical protein [Vicinamibacteria bacterium]